MNRKEYAALIQTRLQEEAERMWQDFPKYVVQSCYIDNLLPPELALDPEQRGNYPFMRLTGPANVLIMPAIHSASISTKLVQALGEATVVGPILLGLAHSVQICPLSASVSKILNMAMMAAYDRPLVEAAEG